VAGEQDLAPLPPTLEHTALRALPRTGGTYGIVLSLAETASCTIGALGHWTLPAGPYLYVGSAWGPGGLQARVGRHLRGGAAPRWHIDYLRARADPIALWLAPGQHLECAWAQALSDDARATIVVPRFGASDCRCPSHLFHLDPDVLTRLDLPGSPQPYALTAES
jgi:Uri superfamily endonuclease